MSRSNFPSAVSRWLHVLTGTPAHRLPSPAPGATRALGAWRPGRGLRGLALILGLLGAAAPAHAAQVTLTWQDNASNEDGFRVERATGTGAYTLLTTVGANSTNHTDTSVAASTNYSYRISAFNTAGASGFSNVSSVTTGPSSSNTAPTISDITNRTVNEDTPTSALAFTIGDAETAAASLTVSGSSSNPTLVPNGAIIFGGSGASRTVTVTPAANQSGATTITVTVSDGTLTTSDTFPLTVIAVNDAPTIGNIANQAVNEDAATGALAFTVGDVETAAASLIVSATSSNTTLVPNAAIVLGGSGANRTVTITPAANLTGTATINVTVSDGGLTASDPFTVTVNAVNDAPTISDVANRTIAEDVTTGALAFTVGDVETAAASLTLSGISSNPALVPNPAIVFGGSGANRTVTITPAANQSGTATITITVGDGATTASDTIALTVTAVNDAPTISNIANQSTNEDTAKSGIAFTIGDAETAVASLTVTGSSSNTTLVPNTAVVFGGSGANRTVTVTPATNQTGSSTITVTVSDGALTATDTFTLTVGAVNDAPTITTVSAPTINEDNATAALAYTIGDAETAAGSLTVSGLSSNLTLVPISGIVFGGTGASRTVTVTPAAHQNGTATITVTVSDGTTSTNTSFTLTVTAVNDAPIISDVANRTIAPGGNTGALAVSVTDVETTAASLTLTGTSSNLTLVPNAAIVFGGSGTNRTVTITAAAGQSGSATITLTVSDGGLTATDTVTLTVTAANTAPTISNITNRTINEDANTGAVAFTIGDAQTAAASLTLSASSSNPTLVPNTAIVFGGSGANRTVTVTPVANQTGAATITVMVSDGALTASDPFTLTVAAVNDAPTISDITDRTIPSNLPAGAIPFTIGDNETNAASLTLSRASSNTTLVPNTSIVFGGSGANRTMTVTPAAGLTGAATITVTVSDGTVSTSMVFTLTIATPASRLLNLSSRVVCRPSLDALIPGFVIDGTASKRVLLRAVGPTLGVAPFNVPGVLPNPRMVLKRWNGTTFVDFNSNDNWSTNANAAQIRQVSAQLFAFAIPDNSLDAVLLVDLAPGSYTVLADDASGGNGVVIVELYDADPTQTGSRFINMSNRGYIGTGSQVMISGFVVSDENPKQLLIRAVGPGIAVAPYNVPGTISDPIIDLYRRNADGTDRLMLTNDNWGDAGGATAVAQVAAQVFAFALPAGSKDAALVTTLQPGIYTVVVRGVNNSTGTALVEVYTVE